MSQWKLDTASEGTILLTNLDPNQFGRGKEREGGQRRERERSFQREKLSLLSKFLDDRTGVWKRSKREN